ncbi:V-type proton ATPase subunit e-like [Teleopsis dalmanni]|uniref:V-type proton ATPase subunit e-like n=1 Tax=Teleopsis dalmanni TaxID=139649 RepID=UPI0018CFB06C|nr:V-type proton ATPase subunit e-like [Teleopsis dalmanni]
MLFKWGQGDQTLFRSFFILTALVTWMFWVLCYFSQMNPLIGPKLEKKAILIIAKNWGHEVRT